MSEIGFRDKRQQLLAQNHLLSPEGRWAIALGLVALLIGLGATAAAAYVGLGPSGRILSLPGGLPSADAGTAAVVMAGCGVVTMLLGAISVYKAYDI